MTLARIKKGDTVQVISGREKGKSGKVLEILTHEERVLIEKLNMVKRHLKPQQKTQGGILEKEAPLALSAVMPFCPKCNKGVRVRTKVVADKKKNEVKNRVCAKCGETLETKK